MWARAENRGAALSAEGEITRPSGRSAMAEESLGMVIFKRLHPAGTPEKPQAHLLLGKLLGPLHAVIVALGLQVDI